MRIVSLLAVFNEERFVADCIGHLARQGVETYVIDNGSTDATREIVESLRDGNVCGIEDLKRHEVFDLAPILRRKEQLHLELGADWYIHHDADMLPQAPNPYRTLAEGIEAVDRAGDNAIDFDEFAFMPTDPNDDHDNERYQEEMRRYVYIDAMPLFHIFAWKNLGQRVLLAHGGHRVAFHGRRVHPERFILRHYIALSPEHALRKYAGRKYARREIAWGWHGKRSTLRADNLAYPDPRHLREISADNVWDRSCPLREEPLFAKAPPPIVWRDTLAGHLTSWRHRAGRLARRVPGLWEMLGRASYPDNRVALRPQGALPTRQHNVLILGSGRSGTSMVAALFRNGGYFMGFDLLAASPANIYGYYEDTGITEINNLLLRRMLRWPLSRYLPMMTPAAHRDPRSLWLAAPRRLRTGGDLIDPVRRLMDAYARQQPFCYKDPRFSVTLPLWERFLPIGTRRIVVFRHPDQTVDSILRDARETYDPPLRISARWAYLSWYRNYRRILHGVDHGGPAIFVRYDDVVDGTALPMLAEFTHAKLDPSQINAEASRATLVESPLRIAQHCRQLYAELYERARTDLTAWKQPGDCGPIEVAPSPRSE